MVKADFKPFCSTLSVSVPSSWGQQAEQVVSSVELVTIDPLGTGESSSPGVVSEGAASCLFSWPNHPLNLSCCASRTSRGHGVHWHVVNGAATECHQQLLLHFILPECRHGVEPLLPCLATNSCSFPRHTIWDQFQPSISWIIHFVSQLVQQHFYTQCVWGVFRRFTLEVINVHSGLAAVTVQWRNASATHIIAYLQESIDLHSCWYPPLSSASLCQLKWSHENELLS